MLISKAEAKYATNSASNATIEHLAEAIVTRLTMVQGVLKLMYMPKPYTGPQMLKETVTHVKVQSNALRDEKSIYTTVKVKPLRAVSATLGEGIQITVVDPDDDENEPEDLGMLTFSLEEMRDVMADFVAPDATVAEIMTEELAEYIIEKIHFVSWRGGKIKKLVLPPALKKRLAPGVFQYTSLDALQA